MKNILYYYIHPESDSIFITTAYDHIELLCLGEVKQRTLKEFKSLLEKESWVLKIYTDEELIKMLELK